MLKFDLSVDELRNQRKKRMDEISNSDILDKIYKQLFNFHEVAIVEIPDHLYKDIVNFISSKGLVVVGVEKVKLEESNNLYRISIDKTSEEGKKTLQLIEASKQDILDKINDSIKNAFKYYCTSTTTDIKVNNNDSVPDLDWLVEILLKKDFNVKINKKFACSTGEMRYSAEISWVL